MTDYNWEDDYDYEEDYPFDYEEDYWDDDEAIFNEFQDPGGQSALRRATPDNPRIYACPTCKRPNRLTRKDIELHYQCDDCADRDEGY